MCNDTAFKKNQLSSWSWHKKYLFWASDARSWIWLERLEFCPCVCVTITAKNIYHLSWNLESPYSLQRRSDVRSVYGVFNYSPPVKKMWPFCGSFRSYGRRARSTIHRTTSLSVISPNSTDYNKTSSLFLGLPKKGLAESDLGQNPDTRNIFFNCKTFFIALLWFSRWFARYKTPFHPNTDFLFLQSETYEFDIYYAINYYILLKWNNNNLFNLHLKSGILPCRTLYIILIYLII